jgi:hypothetical protein
MSEILATWEAEVKRILVPSQSGQKKFARSLVSMENALTCHPSNGRKLKVGGWPGHKSKTLSPK